MSWARNTSISRSYSVRFCSRLFNLKRADPKAPAGVWRNARMVAADSPLRSYRFSVSTPTMPSRPAYMRPIWRRCLRAVSITPQAEALMTAETPPDCAYRALRGGADFMAKLPRVLCGGGGPDRLRQLAQAEGYPMGPSLQQRATPGLTRLPGIGTLAPMRMVLLGAPGSGKGTQAQ